MAHTYDNNKNTLARGRSATGRDITITTPSGSTVIVLSICVGSTTGRTGGAPTVTSGGSGTFSQADQVRTAATEVNVELWYLLSPPIGALTVHIPDDNNLYFTADIASFSAASGNTSALRTANGTTGSSTNPTCPTLTGLATGDVLIGTCGDSDNNWAPSGRTGTSLYEVDDGIYGHATQYYITPDTNNVTLSWTYGTSGDWAACVAAFYEPPQTLGINKTESCKATEVISVSFLPLGINVTDSCRATEVVTASPIAPSVKVYLSAVNGDLPDYGVVPRPSHYWAIDESSGNLLDTGADSTGITLVQQSSPTRTQDWAGRSNQAVISNSSNRYEGSYDVDFANPGPNFTFLMVCKTPTITGLSYPLGAGDGTKDITFIFGTAGGAIYFGCSSPYKYAQASGYSADNTYFHLMGVCENGLLHIYVNGIDRGTNLIGVGQGPDAASGSALLHIAFSVPSGNFEIAQAALWNGVALEASQAKYLYDTFIPVGSQLKRHPDNPETFTPDAIKATEVSQVSIQEAVVDLDINTVQVISITDVIPANGVSIPLTSVDPQPIQTAGVVEVADVYTIQPARAPPAIIESAKATEDKTVQVASQPILSISVSDQTKATEEVQVSVASQPALSIDTVDPAKVTEDIATQIALGIVADDSAKTSEDHTVSIFLSIDTFDPAKATEESQVSVASQSDIVVSVTDQAAVAEIIDIEVPAQTPLSVAVSEQAVVTEETTSALFEDLQVSVSEQIALSDQAPPYLYEIVGITDTVEVFVTAEQVLDRDVSVAEIAKVSEEVAVSIPLSTIQIQSIDTGKATEDVTPYITPQLALDISVADQAKATEEVVAQVTLAVSVSDQGGVMEDVAIAVSSQPTIEVSSAEQITVSEEYQIAYGLVFFETSDQGAVSEEVQVAVAAQSPLAVQGVDQGKVTEEVQVSISLEIQAIDTGKATEVPGVSVASQPDLTVSVADQGGVAESVQIGLDLTVALSEQATVSEVEEVSVTSQAILEIQVVDQAKASEETTFFQSILHLSAVDLVGANDSPNVYFPLSGVIPVFTEESIKLTEEVSVDTTQLDLAISVIEQAKASEAAAVAVTIQTALAVQVDEAARIVEEVLAQQILAISISDQGKVSEELNISVAQQTDLTISVSDTAQAQDVPTLFLPTAGAVGIGVVDSAKTSEEIALNISLAVQGQEAGVVQEVVNVYLSTQATLQIDCAEAVRATEVVGVFATQATLTLLVADQGKVSEDVALNLPSVSGLDLGIEQSAKITEICTLNVSAQPVISISTSEAVKATEEVTASSPQPALTPAATEIIKATEWFEVGIGTLPSNNLAVSDPAKVSENVALQVEAQTILQVSVADQGKVSEDIGLVFAKAISASETVLAQEAVAVNLGVQPTLEIAVQDSCRASESILCSIPTITIQIPVQEQIRASEAVTVSISAQPDLDISVADTLAATEDIESYVIFVHYFSVEDQVGAHDQAVVALAVVGDIDLEVVQSIKVTDLVLIQKGGLEHKVQIQVELGRRQIFVNLIRNNQIEVEMGKRTIVVNLEGRK